MKSLLHPSERRSVAIWRRLRRLRQPLNLILILVVFPTLALAQAGGSPFDTGFTALQTLFTGTVAKVASLIAIVVGGDEFAHGEPGVNATSSDNGLSKLVPPEVAKVCMIVAAMRRVDRRILSVTLRRNRYCAHKSMPETSCEIAPTSPKTGGAIVLKTEARPAGNQAIFVALTAGGQHRLALGSSRRTRPV